MHRDKTTEKNKKIYLSKAYWASFSFFIDLQCFLSLFKYKIPSSSFHTGPDRCSLCICCRGKRERVFLSGCIISVWDQRSCWAGEKRIEANRRCCQWVSRQSQITKVVVAHFKTKLCFQGLTAILTICTLHRRRNSPTAVSKDGSERLKSMVRTESEEFSEWKMTTAAVQLSGKDFCGRGGRRDSDVSLSWHVLISVFPGLESFFLHGMCVQILVEWHRNYTQNVPVLPENARVSFHLGLQFNLKSCCCCSLF